MTLRIKKKESGFTLLEVLISVFVLSTGLLGLAALHMTGLKNNLNSEIRTQAKQLTYDIADRMRANLVEANTGNNYIIAINASGASNSDCETNACSSANMAAYDINAWKIALRAKLPSGDGSVAVIDIPGKRQYIITVQWDDSRGENSPISFTLRTEI